MIIFNLRYRNNLWGLKQSALSFSMAHHFTVGGLFALLITGVTVFMTAIAFELVTITRSFANDVISLEMHRLYPAHARQAALKPQWSQMVHRGTLAGSSLLQLLSPRRKWELDVLLAFYISIIMTSVGSHLEADSLSSAKLNPSLQIVCWRGRRRERPRNLAEHIWQFSGCL